MIPQVSVLNHLVQLLVHLVKFYHMTFFSAMSNPFDLFQNHITFSNIKAARLQDPSHPIYGLLCTEYRLLLYFFEASISIAQLKG